MRNLLAILLLLLWVACAPEEISVEKLQGSWQAESLAHPDSQWLQRFDTCKIRLNFFPCGQAYTSTCSLQIQEYGQGGYASTDTLKYTIKGDELAFVDESTKSNLVYFNAIFRLRRFRWSLPGASELDLKRIDTSVVELRFQRLE